MQALIVGTGFGNLYKKIYQTHGWKVITVDIADQNADYDNIEKVSQSIDIAHVCTPNYTHYELANCAAKISNIVLVEKPGVANSRQWEELLKNNHDSRIMMVKNNQYRSNIQEIIALAKNATTVECVWINKNRIPKPGSWFTNKEYSYGGVSRDLMPHMLSIYQMLNPHWKSTSRTYATSLQQHTLADIDSSDYGSVNLNGVYDVDDFCSMQYTKENQTYTCTVDWRSTSRDDVAVYCYEDRVELGLCPEDAYHRMIETAQNNLRNNNFWQEQKDMDIWIHQQLETL